jgi:predicted small integral membrane protein
MATKLSKVALIWAIALFASLAAVSNITDYDSNYKLVSHVLKMDTTYPDNKGMWRAIDNPIIHHLAYGCIILAELVIAVLCWLGGYRLVKSSKNPDGFNDAKGMATLGLTLGFLLWFTGFMTIGGEWFLMWQSEVANAQQSAFRLVLVIGITLVYLVLPDGENKSQRS